MTVELGVVGPLSLRRDGVAVDDPALRRERVRVLLAYLITHRAASRAELTAALWPDFDERAGANNLRVTLNHLLQALEPWRLERDPSYFVRSDNTELRLVRDKRLLVDVDEFDGHLAAAKRADADGVPSLALAEYLAAVRLWRGELHADVSGQAWLELERERVRAGYVGALQRAAQLLAGRGHGDDVERAEELARRAIGIDPWAEVAYGVLAGTALGRGDRSAARRVLERSYAVAADLGVEPSEDIRHVARRLAAG